MVMDQLTEAKELNRQAAEKIKEYELLEEAKRRYPIGTRYYYLDDKDQRQIKEGGFRFVDAWLTGPNIDAIVNGVYVIWRSDTGWAEIIPEEEKKEKCPDCGLNKGCPYCFCESKIKPEKSLHDQIREGGWEKVIELYCPNSPETLVTDHMFPIPDEAYFKINAFYRLVALSKVLNEGKERPQRIYMVHPEDRNLVCLKRSNSAIEFYTESDRAFALEFAEKEWKIFYNSIDERKK